MDDINRSICKYVKEGKYFEDARAWYLNTFITPISEKAYLFVLVIFYFLVLSTAGYYYSVTQPADPSVSYLLFSEDIAKTYSVIHSPPSSEKLKPQLRINEYLVQNYIETREAYDIKNLKTQLEFIKNTTVANEYQKFENMMSINNSTSPLMIYQDLFTKKSHVKKVNVLKQNYSDGSLKAIAYFQSVLRNLTTNQEIYEDFVATISFKIDNVEDLMKKDAKQLQFLVLDYKLMKIEKNN